MTSTTALTALTAEDRELLARPLQGVLTTAAGPVPPQPRPIWFEALADGTAQWFTPAGAPRLRRLARDPRASLLVATPPGERERWVCLAGRVEVAGTSGAHDLVTRLAARHWDLDDPARAARLRELLAVEQVRLVLHPDDVRRFAV